MKGKAKAAEFLDQGYNIIVTGRHVLVTDAMKDYAIDKLSKLERFSDRIIEVHVTMDIQKLEHRCDIVMWVNHVKIKSSCSCDDMYVSIDGAVDKLENQLRRYKSKLTDHQSKSLHAIDLRVNVLEPSRDQETQEVNYAIDEQNQRDLMDHYRPHRIVAEETLSLKTLSFDEAVMNMELSGNNFLIFRNELDQQLKVIYRRNDGNYGIIELENTAAGA